VAWTSFLEAPSSGEHPVQIYDDLAEIAESVASFLDAGFRAGAPALLVATSDHAETFETQLERAGWHCEKLRRQRLLVILEADDTLAERDRCGRSTCGPSRPPSGVPASSRAARVRGCGCRAGLTAFRPGR
jgi:hypothetical protein